MALCPVYYPTDVAETPAQFQLGISELSSRTLPLESRHQPGLLHNEYEFRLNGIFTLGTATRCRGTSSAE